MAKPAPGPIPALPSGARQTKWKSDAVRLLAVTPCSRMLSAPYTMLVPCAVLLMPSWLMR